MKTLHLLLLLCISFYSAPTFAHQDPDQAGYIDVDGGKIWYRLNGIEHLGKAPAIIVMHGGPGGTHRGNMPYVELSDHYPVILYDQLGTGKSTKFIDDPDQHSTWTVEHFVKEIDQIRNALGLKEIIIAGHSWGGTLSAEYAVKNAKGLRGSIMSSPLISTPQWISDNQIWIDQLPAQARDAIRKNEAAGTTDSAEYRAAEEVFYDYHMCRKNPCPNRGYRAGAELGNNIMYQYMWGPSEFSAPGTLKNYDISPKLNDIKVPVLMICGEFDEAAPKSCYKFAAMIKDATTVIVPNAGHATMAEDHDFYMKSVRDWLKDNIEEP